MHTPLRVLIVEDNADDAELVLRQLRRAGLDVAARRVDSADIVDAALRECTWDIVLADYNLPTFSGVDVLELLRELDLDIPLILVSGVIDVPTALSAMKSGVRDFVLKDDMQRLPSVVEREVAEAEQRCEQRLAEQERDKALLELQEANEQLTAYAGLTDIPLQGMTSARLVESLLDHLLAVSNADGAMIMLLGSDERLVTRGAVGAMVGVTAPRKIETSFMWTVAADNRAVYIADAAVDSRVRPSIRAAGICSLLGVPMRYADKVVGVLVVAWCICVEPAAWQVPLLQIAADRCAIAIENSRIYEQEHGIAETLQKALLTTTLSIPGFDVGHFYGSATTETLVGGDFYDIFETSPGRVAFSIGDVSGKGLKAASITALVKNTLRALTVCGHSPDTVMAESNDVVSRFTDSGTFITSIYGLLDNATNELRYCSAGHPPPAIVGEAGVRMLTEHGPLLGAIEDLDYTCCAEVLAPGESVVMYTDGLTEARTPDGVFYGEERLTEFLGTLAGAASQDIATRLFDEIWEFSGGKLSDDVAILVLALPAPEGDR